MTFSGRATRPAEERETKDKLTVRRVPVQGKGCLSRPFARHLYRRRRLAVRRSRRCRCDWIRHCSLRRNFPPVQCNVWLGGSPVRRCGRVNLKFCHEQKVQHTETLVIQMDDDRATRRGTRQKIRMFHEECRAVAHVNRVRAKRPGMVNIRKLFDGHEEIIPRRSPRRFRESIGMSQKQLAEAAGIRVEALKRAENAKWVKCDFHCQPLSPVKKSHPTRFAFPFCVPPALRSPIRCGRSPRLSPRSGRYHFPLALGAQYII